MNGPFAVSDKVMCVNCNVIVYLLFHSLIAQYREERHNQLIKDCYICPLVI
jgi:hypothetical protein